MRQEFRKAKLSLKNRERLELINSIIHEYQSDGYILTLRQLYYQLVSRDVIPNKQNEYSKLSTLLKEGRMGGIVDWDAIEDRIRKPSIPSSFDGPEDILNAAIGQFKRDRTDGQSVYIEVWVEKDALSGVLSKATAPYHIPMMVNRGYSSVSAMYDSFSRFKRKTEYFKKPCKVLYIGDFDPSGLDMIRDIRERTMEFAEGSGFGSDIDLEIVPVALTMEQIQTYSPPPNPAKVTDPRAAQFISEYGETSWEVDALNPSTLNSLLTDAIMEFFDMEAYRNILKVEEGEREKLEGLRDYL